MRTLADIKEKECSQVAQKIQVLLKGRFVVANNKKEIFYEVEKYDHNQGCLYMYRVFDERGILLTKSQVVKKTLKLNVVNRLYQILPQSEELDIRKSMLSQQDHKLTIKYQVIEGECFPMQIEPAGVPITDYDIKWNKDSRTITQVLNTKMHYAPVQFKGYEMD